uniref:Uncharacterized protein n=1 Tax=Nelumbo nucifera TaxID=4432 RepID=A0A822ZCE8_NELNU|nr:TPA_asm: hypothetical protein HUJ06_013531 [Nelumbo nucifera]
MLLNRGMKESVGYTENHSPWFCHIINLVFLKFIYLEGGNNFFGKDILQRECKWKIIKLFCFYYF